MARLTFGKALDEGDILVLQGIEYHMQPVGMRAMRDLLRIEQDPTSDNAAKVDAAIELIAAAIVPDERPKFREQVEESVPPGVVTQMAQAITRGLTDLDPTPAESSSPGSPSNGRTSTDGAPPEGSPPSNSPSPESSISTYTQSESTPTTGPSTG